MTADFISEKLREAILDAVQAMGGTIVNIKRYPTGSSIVKMALDKSMTHFDQIFAEISTFTLSENERQLLINEELLPDKIQVRGYITKFVQSMAERNIKSLTFKKGITADEIHLFVDILGQRPEELREKGNLTELMKEKGICNIGVDEKVFVALTKGQTVADISELEKLSQIQDGSLNSENFKEGVFIQYLLSNLPVNELNISDQKLNELKQQIDFDNVKNAKNIDIDKLGPIIATALDHWSQDAKAMEEELTSGQIVERHVGLTDEIARAISPELLQTVSSYDAAIASDNLSFSRDERVEKLTNTFEGISRVIYSFKQPGIRAKLLNDFLKIVTNFKAFTLARVLSTRFAEDIEKQVDLKGQILSTMSSKKKSAVIDLFIRKYHNIIEGLSPSDFEFNPSQIDESETVLMRLLHELQVGKQQPELEDKTKKAISLARAIKKEAGDPEKLLILKVRRLMTKEPEFFLDEKIQAYLPDLLIRLLDMDRPDVAKKILEKIFANMSNPDESIRLLIPGSMVRISQALLDIKKFSFHGQMYTYILKSFRQEASQRVYAAFLAVLIADLGRLIEAGNLQFVVQILKNITNLKSVETDQVKVQFLGMSEQKIIEHESIFEYLVERFTSDDEKQSEMAFKILSTLDESRVTPMMLKILETSEEMRVRKKAMTALTRFAQVASPMVREQLGRSEIPWYYARNLIVLAGDMKDEQAVSAIAKFLNHEHPQVRNSALSTLVKFSCAEADQHLLVILPNLDQPNQRVLFTHFGKSRTPAALDYMLEKLDPTLPEKDEAMAIDLITALGKMGSEKAVPAIKKIIRPGKLSGIFGTKVNEKILLVAIRSLGEIGGADAKELVGKFTRHAKPEIAKAAQLSLQNIKS